MGIDVDVVGDLGSASVIGLDIAFVVGNLDIAFWVAGPGIVVIAFVVVVVVAVPGIEGFDFVVME